MTLAALELSENRYYIARAHHLLAYIELERGNAAEALEILDSAEPLIEKAGDRVELALFRVECRGGAGCERGVDEDRRRLLVHD